MLDEYVVRCRRTKYEVYSDFVDCEVPFEQAVELFGFGRVRAFSISGMSNDVNVSTMDSAVLCQPSKPPRANALPAPPASRISLTVGVVDYKNELKERRRGECTSYLASLSVGASGMLPCA